MHLQAAPTISLSVSYVADQVFRESCVRALVECAHHASLRLASPGNQPNPNELAALQCRARRTLPAAAAPLQPAGRPPPAQQYIHPPPYLHSQLASSSSCYLQGRRYPPPMDNLEIDGGIVVARLDQVPRASHHPPPGALLRPPEDAAARARPSSRGGCEGDDQDLLAGRRPDGGVRAGAHRPPRHLHLPLDRRRLGFC